MRVRGILGGSRGLNKNERILLTALREGSGRFLTVFGLKQVSRTEKKLLTDHYQTGGEPMKKMTEIRWHGRGGQGAKTASLLLADVAFSTGMYVQGFPEYGPERMGAPITAYNRLSNEDIRVHSNIYYPDYVAVVDETLLDSVDVTAGLKKEGAIIINTSKTAEEIAPKLKGYEGRIVTVDARRISMETLGRYFPNSPMLAAVVKVSGVMDEESFLKEMEASYQHKFARKPEVIEGNMAALRMTFAEVE